jgi:predicted DNA-binding ribbon-helix-helix protein
MKSVIVKRSIDVNGRKTSISLEDQFWTALKEIAAERQLTLSALVSIVAVCKRERLDALRGDPDAQAGTGGVAGRILC